MEKYGLQVEGSPPGQPATSRYKFLWSKHVRGFNSQHHCANCLVGPFDRIVHRGMVDGIYEIAADTPFFYICGVVEGWKNNLHIAVKFKAGGIVIVDAEYGVRFTLYNAARIPITPLPIGWNRLTKQYTACRNFQFGVQEFGYPSASPGRAKAPTSARLF